MTPSAIAALTEYQGLPHRFQLVKAGARVDWINDSKATNVGATLAALNGVDKRIYAPIVLIAGGDAKGGDLSPLKPVLENDVMHLVVIGRDGPLLAELVTAEKVSFAKDMEQAVALAKAQLTTQVDDKKALVLLSPACASLDMYKNFAARGDAFAQAVEALA